MSHKLPIGEPLWQPEDTVTHEVGSAEKIEEDVDRPVCVLWIPDPEQRHGWREYYVKKSAPKPSGKPMGYRKRT